MAEQQLQPQRPVAEDFFSKLEILYLQEILSELQRGQANIERLERDWTELYPEQRRMVFGAASSALSGAESSTSAIASWRGSLGGRFSTDLALLGKKRMAAGDTPRAR